MGVEPVVPPPQVTVRLTVVYSVLREEYLYGTSLSVHTSPMLLSSARCVSTVVYTADVARLSTST